MTQRRRRRCARRGRFGRRAFLAGAGCAALAGAAVMLGRGQTASASSVPPTDEAESNAALPTGEWRAVWENNLYSRKAGKAKKYFCADYQLFT